MDSMDEYDIRESFDAFDDEKLGRLSIDQFYELYLGLGYPKLALPDLRDQVRKVQTERTVNVETTLKILSKFSRDRKSEISDSFSLVDHEHKGYISVQDIENLARQVGDPITQEEARGMLAQATSNPKIYHTDFRKFLAPPSP